MASVLTPSLYDSGAFANSVALRPRLEPYGRPYSPGRRSSSTGTLTRHAQVSSPTRVDLMSSLMQDWRRDAVAAPAMPGLNGSSATPSHTKPVQYSGRPWVNGVNPNEKPRDRCDYDQDPNSFVAMSKFDFARAVDHRSPSERLDSLEDVVRSSNDRHRQNQAEIQQKLQEVSTFNGRALAEHLALGKFQASLDQRLSQVERLISDITEERGHTISTLRKQVQDAHDVAIQGRHVRHDEVLEMRLAKLESVSDQHKRLTDEVDRKLGDLATLQRRCSDVEVSFVAVEDRVAKITKHLEVKCANLESSMVVARQPKEADVSAMSGALQQVRIMEGSLYAASQWQSKAEERIVLLQTFMAEAENTWATKQDVTTLHQDLQEAFMRCEGKHARLDQRVVFLEGKVCDTVGTNAKQLEVAASVAHEQAEISARLSAMSSFKTRPWS